MEEENEQQPVPFRTKELLLKALEELKCAEITDDGVEVRFYYQGKDFMVYYFNGQEPLLVFRSGIDALFSYSQEEKDRVVEAINCVNSNHSGVFYIDESFKPMICVAFRYLFINPMRDDLFTECVHDVLRDFFSAYKDYWSLT